MPASQGGCYTTLERCCMNRPRKQAKCCTFEFTTKQKVQTLTYGKDNKERSLRQSGREKGQIPGNKPEQL